MVMLQNASRRLHVYDRNEEKETKRITLLYSQSNGATAQCIVVTRRHNSSSADKILIGNPHRAIPRRKTKKPADQTNPKPQA